MVEFAHADPHGRVRHQLTETRLTQVIPFAALLKRFGGALFVDRE